ncbi:MAG: S-layer homology domain-containing protein, partial [Firmicutes bacterium]|nr:S-layer homology domain-containing protein [Bacillota bacterium]
PEQEGSLSATKTIDAAQATEVNVGDSVVYTITVTNGDTSAADVVVSEGLTGDWGVPKLTTADPARTIEYSISDDNLLTVTSLVYDESFTVTYTVIAQPADAGRTLTNSVTLTYTYNNGNGPADGSAAAQNDEVTVAPLYTVTYTNNGADQTTSKPPQDDNKYIKGTAATVLGPKDHGGNLARAGFVLTKWIDDKGKTYEFGQEFAVTGNITLRPVWTPEQVGDLSVTKTTDAAQAREVNVGDSVVYTITVTNDGETNATNLVLGESMTGVWGVPKLTTADPARTIDYAISDNNLLTVDNLASGDSFTVTYTVTAQPADAGKILTNTVTLTYTYNNGNGPVEGSDDAQNDIVTVVPYTVTYTNDGADSATNTPPRDDNKYQYGEAATVLGPKDNGGNLAQAGYVLIKWIDGKGNTYEFDQEFAITGNITLSPVWTPEQTGILSVTKMTDAAQATEVNVGDSVVYTITVTNDGETSATDIAVSESMTGAWGVPELTTADPARRIEYSISGDNLLTVDNLASGDSFTVTYTVTAQPADAGKILTNTVTLTYTYNNGNGPVEGSAAAQNDIVTVAPQAQTNTYMVTYNGNGSTGGTVVSDTSSPYQPGAAVTVLGNTGSLTKPNYKFAGWNTKADGTGISYAPGDTFGMPANDVTLYAQWTLTGGGGGSGSSTPSKPSTGGDAKAVSIPATTDTGTNTGTPPAVLNSTDHIAYILGYPDGKIHPGANITRAEVATIFFRLFTDDSRKANWATSNSYGDVSSSKWYNNAVSTLSTARILKGYPDGTFHPNASITRAEFAAMAARFASGSPATAITFSDLNGNWATDEIYRAAGLGWITGYPDGTFRPNQNITRAEAMSIVNRVLNRRVISADDLRSDMTVWSDSSNVTAWYYFDVQEATNSHTYQRKADGVSEQWTAIVANPDWSAMQQPGYQP